ncbi:MAG: hypothetical protein ACI8RD_006383, partial [Bacillariaceae sp.]
SLQICCELSHSLSEASKEGKVKLNSGEDL